MLGPYGVKGGILEGCEHLVSFLCHLGMQKIEWMEMIYLLCAVKIEIMNTVSVAK